ncbi:MAG: hypothetical protein SNF33_01595 [Candidatus Algichlamydia australiensis]|nr:hypothetical protein [Chlamydiales bacterium]
MPDPVRSRSPSPEPRQQMEGSSRDDSPERIQKVAQEGFMTPPNRQPITPLASSRVGRPACVKKLVFSPVSGLSTIPEIPDEVFHPQTKEEGPPKVDTVAWVVQNAAAIGVEGVKTAFDLNPNLASQRNEILSLLLEIGTFNQDLINFILNYEYPRAEQGPPLNTDFINSRSLAHVPPSVGDGTPSASATSPENPLERAFRKADQNAAMEYLLNSYNDLKDSNKWFKEAIMMGWKDVALSLAERTTEFEDVLYVHEKVNWPDVKSALLRNNPTLKKQYDELFPTVRATSRGTPLKNASYAQSTPLPTANPQSMAMVAAPYSPIKEDSTLRPELLALLNKSTDQLTEGEIRDLLCNGWQEVLRSRNEDLIIHLMGTKVTGNLKDFIVYAIQKRLKKVTEAIIERDVNYGRSLPFRVKSILDNGWFSIAERLYQKFPKLFFSTGIEAHAKKTIKNPDILAFLNDEQGPLKALQTETIGQAQVPGLFKSAVEKKWSKVTENLANLLTEDQALELADVIGMCVKNHWFEISNILLLKYPAVKQIVARNVSNSSDSEEIINYFIDLS